MFLIWTALFLFVGKGRAIEQENVTAVLEGEGKLPYFYPDPKSLRDHVIYIDLNMDSGLSFSQVESQTWKPHDSSDFRCFTLSLNDFQFRKDYAAIYYIAHPISIMPTAKIGCDVYVNFEEDKNTKVFYPIITARDPMMPFYIDKLHEGIEITASDAANEFTAGFTPLTRRKAYCAAMMPIMSTFLEYWETFRIHSETCTKMTELITNCYIFRQVRKMYRKLYEKLCLDEAGCYNAMEYYAEDLPYFVKYLAIKQFKNASVGSWHYNIINYCHLTEMVSVPMDEKFDRGIFKGESKSELKKMCLFLRHRLLPDEGKETEMPDPDEYDYPDDTTTAQYGNGISDNSAFWTITCIIIGHMSY